MIFFPLNFGSTRFDHGQFEIKTFPINARPYST